MLLSFSVPEMVPMLKAGLRQRAREDIGAERVKRQTIRPRGPRSQKLLDWARKASWTIPYDLHLWFKSRTPMREFIGKVECGAPFTSLRVFPIEILHSSVKPVSAPEYQCIRICGPRGWRDGDDVLFWSPQHGGDGFELEARRDGFATADAFRDFFVPKMGDRFDAIIFKW